MAADKAMSIYTVTRDSTCVCATFWRSTSVRKHHTRERPGMENIYSMCSLSPISFSLTHTYTLVLGDVKSVCHNCYQISQLWQLLHAQTQMHASISNTFAEYPTRCTLQE